MWRPGGNGRSTTHSCMELLSLTHVSAPIQSALHVHANGNSQSSAYATIRQMLRLRYSNHTRFDDYYNDLLTQVKAEERASQLHASGGVFSTNQSRVDPQQLNKTKRG